MSASDPCGILGVPASVGPADLKRAYRRKQRTSHPDTGGSAEQFRIIQEAWRMLGHPQRRADYDRSVRLRTAAEPEPERGARPTTKATPARSPTPKEPERPRVRRADSHGHPGGSARLLYLDLLRAWLINPTPPRPPTPWALKKNKRGMFLRQWAKLCGRMTVAFGAVGVGVVLFAAWRLEQLHNGLLVLWIPLALAAGICGVSGAICSLPIGVMRMLRDPYRREQIRFRKEKALRFAAAQTKYRSARHAFESNLRRRPSNVLPLLAAPFSDEAVAVAPTVVRIWLEKAIAQEDTARALKVLGPNFSIWHDLEVGLGKTRIDHLVVAPQGLILIESMNAPGPVSVESQALLHSGRAVPEVLAALRQRALAVTKALGVGGVSAVILVYPDAVLIRGELQRLNGCIVPTFVVGGSRLAGALAAGLPAIDTGASWQIDRLRQGVGKHARFA